MSNKPVRVAAILIVFSGLMFASPTWRASAGPPNVPRSDTLYSQPPIADGGLIHLPYDPGGQFVKYRFWDSFKTALPGTISDISWMGGYNTSVTGPRAVNYFEISIYPSFDSTGAYPNPYNPLVQFQTVGNAGETPAGTFGGIAMNSYQSALSNPLFVNGGTTYWVLISPIQSPNPDWSATRASGGDGLHLLDYCDMVQNSLHCFNIEGKTAPDLAFTLLGKVGTFTFLPLVTR